MWPSSFLQRFTSSNNNTPSTGDDRPTMKTEPESSIDDVNNNKSAEDLMMDISTSDIKQENNVGDTRSDRQQMLDEFTPLSRNNDDYNLDDNSR